MCQDNLHLKHGNMCLCGDSPLVQTLSLLRANRDRRPAEDSETGTKLLAQTHTWDSDARTKGRVASSDQTTDQELSTGVCRKPKVLGDASSLSFIHVCETLNSVSIDPTSHIYYIVVK